MTITEFLLARIAADEEVARCTGPDWDSNDFEKQAHDELLWNMQPHSAVCGWHMGEMNADCRCGYPSRVLAECAVKRQIVEALPQKWSLDLTQVVGIGTDVEFDWWEDRDGARHDMRAETPPGEVAVVPEVLCLLALPYADHPDYDEAWRP